MCKQMCWHANLTGVLKDIRDKCAAGEGASAEFWALKALAQLMDTPIYHGAEATVNKARQALLPGEALSRRASIPWLSLCLSRAVGCSFCENLGLTLRRPSQ